MNRVNLRPRLSLSLVAAALAGCSITPVVVTDAQVRERVQADQRAMYRDQEPVRGPIGFDEAVARALKYNLDQRLKLMETALASGLADLARHDMLPSLLASAGYTRRNNDSGGTSVNIIDGTTSLAPSTSQERSRASAAADFSWNVLDFGVSYYRARQQADQVLIAEERRRRVVQNIVQDVRSAWWRAAAAQRLARDAEALQQRVQVALQRAQEAERQGLVPLRDSLLAQRQLLDAAAVLAQRRNELSYARQELAALMNLPPGTAFTLAEPMLGALRAVPADLSAMEEAALMQRPELREEDYRERISSDEARRQLVSLLPGVRVDFGFNHDSNRYLYNSSWVEGGTQVSLNLLRLLSLPSMKSAQQAQRDTDQARRLALSMAVLTQVRVAVERYRIALADLALARESSSIDQRAVAQARAGLATRTDAELELIRAEVRAMQAEYQRHAAYAAAQNSFGRILNSIGLEVVPADLDARSVAETAAALGRHFAQVEQARFPNEAVAAPSLPALRVRVLGDEGADVSGVAAAVTRALQRNQIPPPLGDAPAPELSMRLSLQPVRDGVRRAEWVISLARVDGSRPGELRYASTLPAAPTPAAVSAFGEAATVSNLGQISQWLRPEVKP